MYYLYFPSIYESGKKFSPLPYNHYLIRLGDKELTCALGGGSWNFFGNCIFRIPPPKPCVKFSVARFCHKFGFLRISQKIEGLEENFLIQIRSS